MLIDLWERRNGTRSRLVEPLGGLAVRTRHHGDAVVVVLVGELDLLVVPLVRDVLVRALREPRQPLIIDLGGLTFIDSSGLHALLDADRRCREAGCALTIWPGPPNVQMVFERTNTIDCLPFASGA